MLFLMDPIELIKEDHRRIEMLFDEYEACAEDEYARRGELAAIIMDELEAHTEMEETIAYPAFRAALDDEGDKKVEEAYAEHDVARNLIDDLRTLAPEDEQFAAKMTVLRENIMHHVEEEEGELLPAAEEAVSGEDMAALGQELQAFKDARDDAAVDGLADELEEGL
jgi:hemerythrin-like domain-containing protein